MSHTDYLLLPHLRVQNANAISGPFTYGFPSITAFMGLMWALERKCDQRFKIKIQFKNIGVISHKVQALIAGEDHRDKIFNQMRRPVLKNGASAPMQEEGRMHLEFSLIFGVKIEKTLTAEEREETAQGILEIVQTMRLAGGIFLPSDFPGSVPVYQRIPRLTGCQRFEKDWRKEKYRLLPGFALIERFELLEERLKKLQREQVEKSSESSCLDAFLSLCALRYRAEKRENGKVEWQHDRQKGAGWIVPIAVGYGAIAPLHSAGSVKDTRDAQSSFQAVESLQSIGEWRAPNHFESVAELLWEAEGDPEKGVYLCRQAQIASGAVFTSISLDENGDLNFDN